MVDVLIRDVPEDSLDAIDATAKRLGLSRNEYLRRQLVAHAATAEASLAVQDLRRFAESFADLADPEVMRGAWE